MKNIAFDNMNNFLAMGQFHLSIFMFSDFFIEYKLY